jgi:hypothetical protein
VALIERLMRWGHDRPDTEPPTFEPPERWMTVHQFFAAAFEVAQGPRTAQEIKNYYNMTPADEVEFDIIVANAPSSAAQLALYLESLHAVFMLAEERVPFYSTPAELRSRLGI